MAARAIRVRALPLLGLLLAGGCGREDGASPAARAGEASPWDERLLRIAASFRGLGLVDDGGRMAPEDCRAPDPPRLRPTASADAATHGGDKVYAMFAKDPAPYRALTGVTAWHGRHEPRDVDGTEGCSQVLVKEAFRPVEVEAGPAPRGGDGSGVADDLAARLRPAEKDGRRFAAGERVGLFVMFRVDPKTPGTDDGWVYGTVTADGKTVTAAGRVASCLKCHEAAPHGRLFGLPR